jgi:hypothetical protein
MKSQIGSMESERHPSPSSVTRSAQDVEPPQENPGMKPSNNGHVQALGTLRVRYSSFRRFYSRELTRTGVAQAQSGCCRFIRS